MVRPNELWNQQVFFSFFSYWKTGVKTQYISLLKLQALTCKNEKVLITNEKIMWRVEPGLPSNNC